MIYSKYGCKDEITGYCGKHTPKGFAIPRILVRVNMFNPDKPDETPQKTYRFASLLRADGGAKEIETAIDLALQLNLKGNELKQAIRAAE